MVGSSRCCACDLFEGYNKFTGELSELTDDHEQTMADTRCFQVEGETKKDNSCIVLYVAVFMTKESFI